MTELNRSFTVNLDILQGVLRFSFTNLVKFLTSYLSLNLFEILEKYSAPTTCLEFFSQKEYKNIKIQKFKNYRMNDIRGCDVII